MVGKKLIISNKSNKPDNIVMHEAEIYSRCLGLCAVFSST